MFLFSRQKDKSLSFLLAIVLSSRCHFPFLPYAKVFYESIGICSTRYLNRCQNLTGCYIERIQKEPFLRHDVDRSANSFQCSRTYNLRRRAISCHFSTQGNPPQIVTSGSAETPTLALLTRSRGQMPPCGSKMVNSGSKATPSGSQVVGFGYTDTPQGSEKREPGVKYPLAARKW